MGREGTDNESEEEKGRGRKTVGEGELSWEGGNLGGLKEMCVMVKK